MKKIKKYILIFSLLTLSSIIFPSCESKKEAHKKFGYDAEYFMGLKQLKEGNEKEARNKFLICAEKGTYYCKRKSEETLCTIGNVQENNKSVLDLYKEYQDSDSLLIAVKQLNSANEIHKIIECTNNIDFETEYNETIRIRLEALKKEKIQGMKQKFTNGSLQDL